MHVHPRLYILRLPLLSPRARVTIVPLFVCRRRMYNVTLVLAQHSKLKMDKKARRRRAAIERRAHSLPPRTMYRRRVCLVRSSIQDPSGSRVGTERSFRARGPSKSAPAATMQSSSAACSARGAHMWVAHCQLQRALGANRASTHLSLSPTVRATTSLKSFTRAHEAGRTTQA